MPGPWSGLVCLVWLGSGLCILTQLFNDAEVCLLLRTIALEGERYRVGSSGAQRSPSGTQEGFIEVGTP